MSELPPTIEITLYEGKNERYEVTVINHEDEAEIATFKSMTAALEWMKIQILKIRGIHFAIIEN